jgi:hypothetical protein
VLSHLRPCVLPDADDAVLEGVEHLTNLERARAGVWGGGGAAVQPGVSRQARLDRHLERPELRSGGTAHVARDTLPEATSK